MESDKAAQTIQLLNAALAEALTVITQFFLHAAILKARRHEVAERCYKEWVATMERSDRLLDGILALGGAPTSREPSGLDLDHRPRRIFENDIVLTERWIELLKQTVASVEAVGSYDAPAILDQLIEAESASLEWRRHQLDTVTSEIEDEPLEPTVDANLGDVLDRVLRSELSSITQAYYHGRLFEAWGAKEAAAFMADETWAKTWRSLELTEHMLSIGRMPSSEAHGTVVIGENLANALSCDGAWLDAQIALLQMAIDQCDADQHPATHDLLSRMQEGERLHADWINAQVSGKENRSQGGGTQDG